MSRKNKLWWWIKDIGETIVFRISEFRKNWIYPAYDLRNLLFHRYDLVRLPGLKPQKYCDCMERIFLANMALIVEFIEKEKPEDYVLWYEDKDGRTGPKYGIPENTRLYLPEYHGQYVMDIIKKIYHWYKEVYPSLQKDSKTVLDFWYRVHCGEMKDAGMPDENGLIPFEFDKSGCPKTVQEIKALPNIDWQIIQRYLKEEEFLDGNLVQGKHTEIENRIFNESQEMLHLCIEVRSHLWI